MNNNSVTPETIPICRSCVYFTRGDYGYMCSHPDAGRNPVNGRLKDECHSLRLCEFNHCGPKGNGHSYKREKKKRKKCNGCKWAKRNWIGSEYTECSHPYVVAVNFDPVKGGLPSCSLERKYGNKCGQEGALYE